MNSTAKLCLLALTLLIIALVFTVEWFKDENRIDPMEGLTAGECPIFAHDITVAKSCKNKQSKRFDGIIFVNSPIDEDLIDFKRVFKCRKSVENLRFELDTIYPINSTYRCYYSDEVIRFKKYPKIKLTKN